MLPSFVTDHPIAFLVSLIILAVLIIVGGLRSLWLRARSPAASRGPKWRAGVAFFLIGIASGVVLLTSAGLMKFGPRWLAQSELIDKPAESFDYRLVKDNSPGNLNDHLGEVVLVNVWATWCPTCRAEMPDLDQLQRKLGQRGLVVLTVSDEERSKIEAYLEESPLATKNAYVETRPWRTQSQPTSFIIDREGIVREVIRGRRGYEFFAEAVDHYL